MINPEVVNSFPKARNPVIIARMGEIEIRRNWTWIAQLLLPAIERDGYRSLGDVFNDLIYGHLGLASVHMEGAAGLLVIEPVPADGGMVLWVPYFGGRIKGKYRRFLVVVRTLMAELEKLAAEIGCKEVRISGRDWSHVLSDYVRVESHVPNEIVKMI